MMSSNKTRNVAVTGWRITSGVRFGMMGWGVVGCVDRDRDVRCLTLGAVRA